MTRRRATLHARAVLYRRWRRFRRTFLAYWLAWGTAPLSACALAYFLPHH